MFTISLAFLSSHKFFLCMSFPNYERLKSRSLWKMLVAQVFNSTSFCAIYYNFLYFYWTTDSYHSSNWICKKDWPPITLSHYVRCPPPPTYCHLIAVGHISGLPENYWFRNSMSEQDHFSSRKKILHLDVPYRSNYLSFGYLACIWGCLWITWGSLQL